MARDGGRPPSLARRIPGRLASIVALSVIAAAVCVAPTRAQSLQSKPAPPTPPPDQPVVVRVEGGLVLCCATKGFIAGGEIAAQPHALDGVEVSGDATVGRFGGFSLLTFAADARYGVQIGRVKPYGGGGVGIVKTTGGGPTNVGAQVVAGVQLPSWGRHTVRVEARFLFLPVETTLIIGSVSF